MNSLVIGSGGREFTIGLKLAQSNLISQVFFAPGNGGTNKLGKNLNVNIFDFESLYSEIKNKNVELIIVGPEAPLVDGIVDFLKNKNDNSLKIVGPTAKGAMLEGSKAFAKEFMIKNKIPTARYRSFTKNTLDDGINFLKDLNAPYVLKADGLAAGKGVLILKDLDEAINELTKMLSGKFGKASECVVIEEFLDGIELSVFVVTDGENYTILPNSKDYKRIGENDTGLNTGGMGAVSPVPFADEAFMNAIEEKVIKPTISGFQKEKIDYKGFVFFGLINVKGEPYVIEYNVRMGDPETQVVLPRIESDFAEMMLAITNKSLKNYNIKISDKTALAVVLASGGYPENYEKGKEISFKNNIEDAIIIHAGTKLENGVLETSGGRVITVTAIGKDIDSARVVAYSVANEINFDKKYFRNDIGLDLL